MNDIVENASFIVHFWKILFYVHNGMVVFQKLSVDKLAELKQVIRETIDSDYD